MGAMKTVFHVTLTMSGIMEKHNGLSLKRMNGTSYYHSTSVTKALFKLARLVEDELFSCEKCPARLLCDDGFSCSGSLVLWAQCGDKFVKKLSRDKQKRARMRASE